MTNDKNEKLLLLSIEELNKAIKHLMKIPNWGHHLVDCVVHVRETISTLILRKHELFEDEREK